jgi:pimeloyl-ACP methyl ester carboxylesterase
VGVDREQQRERLRTAEAAVFARSGIEARAATVRLREPAITTRVLTLGEGPPAVLLHGANLASVVWAPLLPHLRGRTWHLVDLPGCGFADPVDLRGVDYPRHQATFVGSVFDALELDLAALVGASLGGWFALRSAVEHPGRLTALGVVSAPALALPGARVPLPMAVFGRPAIARVNARFVPAPSARMTRRALATIGGPGSVRDVPEVMFEALGAALALAATSNVHAVAAMTRGRAAHPDAVITDEDLAACPVPTLLLWGEDDRVQSPTAGQRAAAALPHGRLEVLPGGHALWFEQPERCGDLLSTFLAAHDPT